MERPANPGAPNPVTQSIDGATGDMTMSGDAMRWSPELAEGQPVAGPPPWALPGADAALGALLALDAPGVRRLVSGAVTSLATVAGDVVAELRQLTRGPDGDGRDDGRDDGGPRPPGPPPPA
ncbi:hypothetical protein SAMN06893096_11044 [Geodermatophilus pulveris]|uniref:Uncharacterized protein n=1 Tax=Geodermatophilus pulveris TaxID=1564159 RepID=A0A239I912_9ACTN|nr:hypothetical protein [Geodermatophilus pulveris]SNS89798.1 hypothetical protein SAMN06893096_11044 [Geodermatophilus pulveris]